MKLTTAIWLIFTLCLLLVLAAMGWLSATALRLDRAEIEARRQAVLEEKVRLALWRMDSGLAPTVAQESARPYFAYLAYLPADRSYNRMFNSRTQGETLIASPLLVETPPRVLLHFQFDAAGNLTSPQLPQSLQEDEKSSPQGKARGRLQQGQFSQAITSAGQVPLLPQSPLTATHESLYEITQFHLDADVQKKREKQFARLKELVTLEKLAVLLPQPKPVELKIVDSAAVAYEPQRGYPNASGMRGSGGYSSLYADTKSPQAETYDAPQIANMPQQRNVPQRGVQRQGGEVQPSDSLKPQQPPAFESSQSELMPQQMQQSRREYAQRAQSVKQSVDVMAMNQAANMPADYEFSRKKSDASSLTINGTLPMPSMPSSATAFTPKEGDKPNTDMGGVLMTPLWIDGELILARRVLVAGQQYVQGCLLDWSDIRGWLKGEIADLLPEAELVPAELSDTIGESRLLAALPIRLVPGMVAVDGEKNWSPLALSLLAAWICLLMTAAAIIGLLTGVMRLSARRASFVTAVTHELRTPLTTFQMYAEMLAEDMVPEPAQQKAYLKTLRAEAVRLTHLVENVLAYARLERGRLDRRMETISLVDLIASMQNRLTDRASQAGMDLVVENGEKIENILVKTNISAVEQILFNLVDNACKYAASADDKRIHLILQEADGNAQVRVEDHGPGIASEMRNRLFRSFSKTAKEAAHSAPGVGLGLALSRRLARDLGGELSFQERHTPGACFLLTLPLA